MNSTDISVSLAPLLLNLLAFISPGCEMGIITCSGVPWIFQDFEAEKLP